MKIGAIILLLILHMGICSEIANANMNKSNNIVFLSFSNNTKFPNINSQEILSEYLFSRMIDLQEFQVIEHSDDAEVEEIEQRFNINQDKIEEAASNNDFSYLYSAYDNNINQKQVGQSLPARDIQLIASKYNADYILHGSVDYLGTDVEVDTSLVRVIGIEKTKPYLIAVATVRIIDALDGRVIWTCVTYGKSKDHLYSYKGFSAGTGELHEQLFYDAIDKTSENIVGQLEQDLQSKRLQLRNGAIK